MNVLADVGCSQAVREKIEAAQTMQVKAGVRIMLSDGESITMSRQTSRKNVAKD
ncbi:MAG: hypothetical protein V4793_11015 [Paraburkholderia tropica]